MMKFRNAKFLENGWIDCEIEHPSLGWIPFVCPPDNDSGTPLNNVALHAEMIASGTVLPFIQEEFQIEAAIAQAMASIDQFHGESVQRLVGNPTQVEKDTWALKLEVANAITSKAAVSAAGQAFLASAGIATDAAKSAWAASVLAKSSAYAQVVGLAEKLRDTARTAVKAASDEASLKAALDAQRAAADAVVASLLKGT